MTLAFSCLFFVLHLMAMRTEVLRRRVQALHQTQVDAAGQAAGTRA
jgi:heme exporter protein C